MTAKSHICGLATLVLPAAFVAGFLTAAAVACDTPVYRYAMYNWSAAPYQVFFFYNPAEKDADAAEVNRLLLDLSTSVQPANVNLIEVDVTDRESIERLPEEITASWKRCRRQNGTKPSGGVHVVFSPWGQELFAGKLHLDTVRSMTESPARKRLAELLAQGKLVAVCLIPEQEADDRLLDEAIQNRAQPGAADGESPQVEVARLNVSPGDPRETWFVKNLMLAEPDLDEYAGQPMLFMAYGRGRLMLPYIGKGITADNLASCVSFLTGACSCEVKADNPGVDLLMRCNWEAAAEAMAANDDNAAAGDGQLAYYEFDPSQPTNNQPSQSRKPRRENDTDRPHEEPQSGIQPHETADAVDAVDAVQPASSGPFASRQTWMLGGGLAVLVVAVLIGGLFVMRRS